MDLLLDTHTLVWWLTRSEALSARAAKAIGDSGNLVHISAASAWEIATKARIGQLHLPPRALSTLDDLPGLSGFVELAIHWRHAALAGAWPVAHRDPFDRLLAAQARFEQLTLVTIDPVFADFNVKTFW